MQHFAELGAIDVGHQVIDQGHIETAAGRELLLQRRKRLPPPGDTAALGAPARELRFEHAPIHFEIIHDEHAPPGDVQGRQAKLHRLGRLDREGEPECRAGAGRAVDSNFSAHEPDELPADCRDRVPSPHSGGWSMHPPG